MAEQINLQMSIGDFFDDHNIASTFVRAYEMKKFFEVHKIETLNDILGYTKKELHPLGLSTVHRLEKALLKYDLTLIGRKLPVKPLIASQYRKAIAMMLFKADGHDVAYFDLLGDAARHKYLKAAEDYTRKALNL